MSERTFAVVNPASAAGRTGKRWPELASRLRSRVGEFSVAFTEAPGQATELARAALRDGAGHVVSVGGDGTHNEVANAFFGKDGTPVASEAHLSIVPTGTGGDLRRTLNLPADALAAIEFAGHNPQAVDVGRVDFVNHAGVADSRFFLNIASFGLSGMVDQVVNQSSKMLGAKPSFLLAVARATLRYRSHDVNLYFDDDPTPVARTVLNVVLANAQYFGGGMQVAPRALMTDGRFEVVVISHLSRLQQAVHMGKMYRGNVAGIPRTEERQATHLRAEAIDPTARVLVDVDGEQPGCLPARFSLMSKALRLCRGPDV
jgi:YegS/Rv2252/BmrU family lipid kinase